MIHVHLKAVLNLQLQCTVQCNYDLRNLSDMKSECFANYSFNNIYGNGKSVLVVCWPHAYSNVLKNTFCELLVTYN